VSDGAAPADAPAVTAADAPAQGVRLRRDGKPDRRIRRRTTAAPKGKAAAKRSPARTAPPRLEPLDAPRNPTIARLVMELDTEIDALQRARTVAEPC
jgi:hypothetical protein